MNKNIATVKKLLKIDLFTPYKLHEKVQRWDTGVQIRPTDYTEKRLKELAEKGGLDFGIIDCYFKGENTVFGLSLINADKADWKGYFKLGFLLPVGIDGNVYSNRPSELDRDNFLRFLRGDDE